MDSGHEGGYRNNGAAALERISAGKMGKSAVRHQDWGNFEEYDPHTSLEVMDGTMESFGTLDVSKWNMSHGDGAEYVEGISLSYQHYAICSRGL